MAVTHASSPQSQSPTSCTPSLSISMPGSTQWNTRLVTAEVYFRHLPNQYGPTQTKDINSSTSSRNKRKSSSTSQPSNPSHADTTRPIPYPTHLVLLPSQKRPHVLARNRLYAWKPALLRSNTVDPSITISDADLQRIETVIGESWSEST